MTVAPCTTNLPGKTQAATAFPPGTRNARELAAPRSRSKLKRRFRYRTRSEKKNPADLKVVIRHYRCDAISSSTQQPNLLFRHVLFPKSSSFPPTPKPVLRGCGDHWLRTTLLKCFRLLDCYGASSGTNYLEHYSTPTQCLCVQSKVRLAYNHTAMHWSTPCHCKHHKLWACKGRVKNNLKALVYSHLLMALSK